MSRYSFAATFNQAIDYFLVFCLVVAGALMVAWLVTLIVTRTRPMLNCLIVAVALRVDGGCRQYLWTRRSRSCRGMLPHFGTAQQMPGRTVRVVEYIPPRNGEIDSGLIFQGGYRVWHLRVTDVRRFSDRAAALDYTPTVNIHAIC